MSAEGARQVELRLGRLLAPFLADDTAGIVLAVSGGPDSTALMHAAATHRRNARIAVATVDHGLRRESAAEAERVAASAASLGLPHATLVWSGPKPVTGLSAAAREARYRLLAAHAGSVGAGLVLTGHTADDQAETVLMRLLAGSGPAGLAGMRRTRLLAPGIHLGRPFLALPKSDLVAYCEAYDLRYVGDPSNTDDRFARARLRRIMPLLAQEGLTAERLTRLAERCARDDDALAEAASTGLASAVRAGEGGFVLDGAVLESLPEAVILKVFAEALDRAGAEAPVRLARLERLVLGELVPALRAGTPIRRTLAGILIAVTRSGDVAMSAAPARRLPGKRPLAADPVTLAAGAPDLLGKGEGAAYIGPACQD